MLVVLFHKFIMTGRFCLKYVEIVKVLQMIKRWGNIRFLHESSIRKDKVYIR